MCVCFLLILGGLHGNASATQESLGAVYQALANPQTGEPIVCSVPIMNFEPGGMKNALPLICQSNSLVDAYWVRSRRPAGLDAPDSNLASTHGLSIEVDSVEFDRDLVLPTIRLDVSRGRNPEDGRAPTEALVRAVVECIAKTVAYYDGNCFRLIVKTDESKAQAVLRNFEGEYLGTRRVDAGRSVPQDEDETARRQTR